MPKYIEKDKLPQFQYYNFCEGVHDNWGEEPKPYAKYHTGQMGADIEYIGDSEGTDIELANDDFQRLLNRGIKGDDNTWIDVHMDWMDSLRNKKGKQYDLVSYMLIALYAMHKDRYTAEKWKERFDNKVKETFLKENGGVLSETMLFLSMLDEYLSFATTLRTCQGFPLNYNDGDTAYPKMLLIESEFYKKQRDSGEFNLDYSLMKNALRDACYVISINGESAERKMCFCLCDTGTMLTLSMLDPNNGQTRLFVKPFSEASEEVKEYNSKHEEKLHGDAVIVADAWRCHPRGDYWCNGKENMCVFCDGKHNCKHKTLNIAAAVLYCFQEYIRKIKDSKTRSADKNSSTKANGKEVKTMIPSGMIRMYEIKYSDEELERVNKYAMFGKHRSEYPSTEKSPHVRKGTMRYNPKTGQKDIVVKGSIIHKDRYQGFVSAERLTE